MPELRVCKFKIMISDGAGRLVSSEWYQGKFHQWGSSFDECSIQGFVPSTVGIVEDDTDGHVYEVRPCDIRFTDK